MIATAGLLLFAATAGAVDEDRLAAAERAFAEGVYLKDDAAKARPAFARAASAYDELWQRGYRAPALALNRAKAHRLADDLQGAVVALHDGLAVARHDRSLQAELDEARAAVAYPLDGVLAAECRPRPVHTVGTRMSPAEAYLVAGSLWLLAWLAAARFAMTRNRCWLLLGGGCLIGLGVLGWAWWDDCRQRDAAGPLVVVADATHLRRGNGPHWEPRLEQPLPPGVEAREFTRRGGWVQVELAGGAVGWLPEWSVRR